MNKRVIFWISKILSLGHEKIKLDKFVPREIDDIQKAVVLL